MASPTPTKCSRLSVASSSTITTFTRTAKFRIFPIDNLMLLMTIMMMTMMIVTTSTVVAGESQDRKQDTGNGVDDLASATLSSSSSSSANSGTDGSQTPTYGVDVSFPIHRSVSINYPVANGSHSFSGMPLQVLGDRRKIYMDHLQGCRDFYPPPRRGRGEDVHDKNNHKSNAKNDSPCDVFEYERLLMNRIQPPSMQNYTKEGFRKARAPDSIVRGIRKFWTDNHLRGTEEKWEYGNSFINHWDSPTYMVAVEDNRLRGGGTNFKERIWAAASATLEEWTEQELQPCSLYGIRVYTSGAIMLPHVNRLPFVISAIISVAQDVDEPWPFELYDHHGYAHNVTIEPGEMLLLESHSIIHGHSFPLKGYFAAYIFLHFEPTGRPLHRDSAGRFHYDPALDKKYREALQRGQAGPPSHVDGRLPPYIIRESLEEQIWRKSHPEGWSPPSEILPPEAHIHALKGDVAKLEEELNSTYDDSQKILTQRDDQGWQILHQGVVSGKKEVVELLVHRGAEINARTHGGYGETPLRIAEKEWGSNHPIVHYLTSLGALSLGPEL